MKEKYDDLELEMIVFENTDVIVTSDDTYMDTP